MYQKDFILRMIEMLADLIAGILGLIKKGDFQKATLAINNAYQDFLKHDAEVLGNIPSENLIDELVNKHNFTTGHFEILYELFYAHAELFFAEEKFTESCGFYKKALLLLKFVIDKSQTYSFEKQAKLIAIQNKISELEK